MRTHADIQGNILRGYASHLHAAYLLAGIGDDPGQARALLARLVDEDQIATERDWGDAPATRLNVALTRPGLRRLGVDMTPFAQYPEFWEGMFERARARLGDLGDNDPSKWDEPLTQGVDLLFTVYGLTPERRTEAAERVEAALQRAGMRVVHRQDADMLEDGREHFGFADGFSQPALRGKSEDRRARNGEGVQRGRLRLTGEEWRNVELGEFVLGYRDEDGVVPGGREPLLVNGTFMVWRKLEQHVEVFQNWIRRHAGDDAYAQRALQAKILGRWPNGDSLVREPESAPAGARSHDRQINDFTYSGDPGGVRCPLGAHVRRANPRDALGFRTERTRRNRIIRRGLPYVDRDETRGLIFVCFNASIARQFEQVQGNWLMGGDTFGLGAECDFLTAGLDPGQPRVRMTIQGDRAHPPSFIWRDEAFVTVRGGYYLFVPGLRALRRIAGR